MMKDIDCYNKEKLKMIIEEHVKHLNIHNIVEMNYFDEVFGCFMDIVKKHDLDITTKKGYRLSTSLLRGKISTLKNRLRSLEIASKEELLNYARSCAFTHYLRV